MNRQFKHFDPKQIFLFLAVGGFSTVLNYGVFWAAFRFGHVYYLPASWIGYAAGVLAGYMLNSRYTFESPLSGRYLLFYILVYIISLVLSTATLALLVQVMRMRPETANILAICQSTLTNYFGCKYFVFRKKAQA